MIVVSSCIVGRFWVCHRLFFIGYEVAQETWSLLCRVALWEGFECDIASLIGCYHVEEETGSKSSPETVSLNQFDTTRTQSPRATRQNGQ